MKILMIAHGFPPECSGGTESYVLALAKELIALDHVVEIVTGSHDARPTVEIEAYEHERIKVHKLHRSGLFVDDWDKSYAPEIGPALDQVLGSFRPDLVHVHHWIRLSRHLVEFFHDRGIPTVCTLHDLWTTCPIAFRVRKGSFCELPAGATSCHDCAPHASRADDRENAEALDLFRDDFRNELDLTRRVIVPSRAHRGVVLQHHPGIAGKMRVVPHGTISDIRARAPSGTRSGRIRAGHWGHLSKLKGIDVLLEAAASLPDRVKDRLELHVFGQVVYPGEKAGIEALAKRSNTTLHGPFVPSDLESIALDFAVIPTRCSESHSFVLDEAFLLGLPAIVPAQGALADRIGKAGTTFAPGDPADLARKLSDVVSRKGLLSEWRTAIPKLRPMAAHAREILSVYHELISSEAPLPVTPSALRERRAAFRSLQVESRNRRLEFLEGDQKNMAADLERATTTMRDMQRFHVEKDKVIADQKLSVDSLGHQVRSQTEALESLKARANEAISSASNLAVELGRARLEVNDVVRKAAEHEHAIRSEVDAAVRSARENAARLEGELRDAARKAAERERELDERIIDAARKSAERERELEERIIDAARKSAEREHALESQPSRRELDLLARTTAERAEARHAVERRDSLLGEMAATLDDLVSRLGAAGRAAARTTRSSAHPEGGSLIERIKRTAFGDGRKHSGRLRILYVLHQFVPRHVAGTEVYTLNLAREMKARGHRAAILTCEAHHDLQPFTYARREQDGLPIHEVVHNYRWSSFEETYDSPRADAIFERVLDEEMPDVVHIQHLHYFSANFITIAHRRGIPIVYTLHDYSILCARDGQLRRADGEICQDAIPAKCADCISHFALDPDHVPARNRISEAESLVPPEVRQVMRRVHAGLSPIAPPGEETTSGGPGERYVEAASERLKAWRHAVAGVDQFISPSHFLKDLFARSGMIPEGKILVSPNGQDLARFQHGTPRVRGSALRFGYVGTIAEHKGIHVLVEAMNGLRDQPAAECRIWGDLKAFTGYSDRILAQNQNPRTQFLGPFQNADVAEVLSGIDVLVIPSLWFENAPLTIQEAALARIPVIASDHGGLAEHVIEGVTGLKFYPGDANDLRNKLVWFVEDFSRCDQFDFSKVPVVSIQDDAARNEERYLALLAGPLA